jgi:hypothetical protein
MASFVVWDMSSKADGVWKTVEAADARTAAESICTKKLRSVGSDNEICVRVRSLDDPNLPASMFYGEKSGAAAREDKKNEARQEKIKALEAAE